MTLATQTCVPCTGAETPLSLEEAQALVAQVEGWEMLDDATLILRELYFTNFAEAYDVVQKISALAEAEGHHPDIAFGWGYCSIALQTDTIEALTRNDFIMAAKINALLS